MSPVTCIHSLNKYECELQPVLAGLALTQFALHSLRSRQPCLVHILDLHVRHWAMQLQLPLSLPLPLAMAVQDAAGRRERLSLS